MLEVEGGDDANDVLITRTPGAYRVTSHRKYFVPYGDASSESLQRSSRFLSTRPILSSASQAVRVIFTPQTIYIVENYAISLVQTNSGRVTINFKDELAQRQVCGSILPTTLILQSRIARSQKLCSIETLA